MSLVGNNSSERLAGRLHKDCSGFSGVFFSSRELGVEDEKVYF